MGARERSALLVIHDILSNYVLVNDSLRVMTDFSGFILISLALVTEMIRVIHYL